MTRPDHPVPFAPNQSPLSLLAKAPATVSIKDGLGSDSIRLDRLERAVQNLLRYAPPDAEVTFVYGSNGQRQVVATWPEERAPR